MHRMIKGHVLTNVYKEMTPVQKNKFAEDVAEYLVALQAVKPRRIKLEPLSAFLSGLAKVNNDNYDYSVLQPLADMEQASLLSHGDFNPGNLLLDDNYRLIAVLDYAFVSYSCKENDLSRLIGRLPPVFYNIIIDAYESKSKVKVDRLKIDGLVSIWHYVEKDYIAYMRRCHKDVILPEL